MNWKKIWGIGNRNKVYVIRLMSIDSQNMNFRLTGSTAKQQRAIVASIDNQWNL